MSKIVLLDLPPLLTHSFTIKNGVKYIITSTQTEWDQTKHHMPDWMSPHLHIVLEELMRIHFGPLVKTIVGIPYHIIHGFICGYNMRKVVSFLRSYYRGLNGSKIDG